METYVFLHWKPMQIDSLRYMKSISMCLRYFGLDIKLLIITDYRDFHGLISHIFNFIQNLVEPLVIFALQNVFVFVTIISDKFNAETLNQRLLLNSVTVMCCSLWRIHWNYLDAHIRSSICRIWCRLLYLQR